VTILAFLTLAVPVLSAIDTNVPMGQPIDCGLLVNRSSGGTVAMSRLSHLIQSGGGSALVAGGCVVAGPLDWTVDVAVGYEVVPRSSQHCT
jgi:hypothetical protein